MPRRFNAQLKSGRGLDHSQIVCWQWHADHHCGRCTVEVFGLAALDDGTAEDVEGNPVYALYGWDEIETPLSCGSCREIIAE